MFKELEYIRREVPNIITEVLIRVVMLFIVCILQTCVDPHQRHITELELANYMRPRKDSYIPSWAMVLIIVFVPLFFLCAPYFITKNFEDTIPSLLSWTMGLTINAFLTESTKLTVGRPRPDFFYRCYPKGKITSQFHGNVKDIMEGRKSFPSGHSSFAFCSMGFLFLWSCGRLKIISRRRGKRTYEWLHIMACFLPLVLATLIAICRSWDNHHHWEDILVGSVLGFASSYYSYRRYFYPLCSQLSGYPYIKRGPLPKRLSFNLGEEYSSNSDTEESCVNYKTFKNKTY